MSVFYPRPFICERGIFGRKPIYCGDIRTGLHSPMSNENIAFIGIGRIFRKAVLSGNNSAVRVGCAPKESHCRVSDGYLYLRIGDSEGVRFSDFSKTFCFIRSPFINLFVYNRGTNSKNRLYSKDAAYRCCVRIDLVMSTVPETSPSLPQSICFKSLIVPLWFFDR